MVRADVLHILIFCVVQKILSLIATAANIGVPGCCRYACCRHLSFPSLFSCTQLFQLREGCYFHCLSMLSIGLLADCFFISVPELSHFPDLLYLIFLDSWDSYINKPTSNSLYIFFSPGVGSNYMWAMFFFVIVWRCTISSTILVFTKIISMPLHASLLVLTCVVKFFQQGTLLWVCNHGRLLLIITVSLYEGFGVNWFFVIFCCQCFILDNIL